VAEYPWTRTRPRGGTIEDPLDAEILKEYVTGRTGDILPLLFDCFLDGARSHTGLRTNNQFWIFSSTLLNAPLEVTAVRMRIKSF
jgi:hypothetical protein